MTPDIDIEDEGGASLPPEVRSQFDAIIAQLAEGQKRIRPVLEEIGRATMPYRAALQNIAVTLAPYAAQFQAALEKIAPALIAISKAVEGMPDRTAEALRILAQNGWYLDPAMLPREVFERADEFKTGITDQAHRKLREYFDMNLDEVERALCERAPTRAKFLRSALSAHRRGDFAAAIPLLLA